MKQENVDVVVLTKNSERILRKCLNSIFENVPVNRLIVVDGYSTDSTLRIVQEFEDKFGNVLLLKDGGTRGSARMKGIQSVETEWFLFVDSDVTLCEDWYDKARKHVNGDDVGAVWGIEIWAGIRNPRVLKLFLTITRRIFEIRGGTHDLLVRHECVEDIKIPEKLHVFEDALIKNWIAKKGYRLIPAYDPFCMHYRPQSVWSVKGSVDQLIDTVRYSQLRKIPKYSLMYSFYTIYVMYRSIMERMKEHSNRSEA